MNREESLVEFNNKVIPKYIEDCRRKFQINLIKYEEKLTEILIESIVKINEKVKLIREKKEYYAINILQYELLRTNILDESFVIWLHEYNVSWYMDEDSVHEEIDLKFLFEPFIELKKCLISEKSLYLGKVNDYDIQNIIFDEVRRCYYNMESYIREIFYDLDENEKMKNVLFDEYYMIKWSEFRDESKTVFSMDYRNKGIDDLKKFCKEPYVYPVFRNSSLSKFDMNDISILYGNFKESELIGINMNECTSPRCEYSYVKYASSTLKSCNMVGSNFRYTKLNSMVVENCDLTGCNFNYSDCVGVTFKNCNLENSSFYKSSFYNVKFINCSLKGINFIDSHFEKISFNNSDLTEAAFNEEVIPFIHISAEQLQDINIWGDIK